MIPILAMAQSRTNPNVADYYIKGHLSINHGIYKLSRITTKGISFDKPDLIRIGEVTDREDVLFQFDHYSTDYPGGIGKKLDFWRFDESINEWQPDGETRQGNAKVPDNRSMVLMLVLDCSSSLKSDFKKVQGAAKDFIKDMLDASGGKGKVKIGIVAFSKIGETAFFPITSLTDYSYSNMCNFIDWQHIANGTALYYAMDKAVDSMEYYCVNSIPKDEPLSAAILVTFTDGLDQTSRSERDGINTADQYYDAVLSRYGTKMQNKRINGIPLQSKIRGVRGDDIITEKQLEKFKQIGNSLGEFKLLKDVSELGKEFKDIAKGLIGNFVVMECYVPNSFEGDVAWTYRSKEARQKRKIFFGINAGIGMANCGVDEYDTDWYGRYKYFIENRAYLGLVADVGFDLAVPLGDRINLGLYTSFGYDGGSWHNTLFLGGGPLMLINFNNGSSLYLGGGVHYPMQYEDLGIGLRVGYKFKKGLYLFIEDNYYKGKQFDERKEWNYYPYNSYYIDYYSANNILFHIGYSF